MRIFLKWIANSSALAGGLILSAIMITTVASVVGRYFGKGITGDFELTAAFSGAAVALFLPWCQYTQGNIIVDFFTSKASDSTRFLLDRIGALAIGVMMALFAWRTFLGLLSAKNSGSGSMLLGFPEWIVYSFIFVGLTITTLVAMHQCLFGFAQSEDDNPELAL